MTERWKMDKRIVNTKERITDRFMKLLKTTALDKITVTQICRRANINRATFYKYYDNPYNLLGKIESEYINLFEMRRFSTGFVADFKHHCRHKRFVYRVDREKRRQRFPQKGFWTLLQAEHGYNQWKIPHPVWWGKKVDVLFYRGRL